MNNDIKEILEEIKSYTEHEYLPPYCELAPQDCKILLDYITNLQEENKILKELNVCVGCNNNPDYKSRIDKAIEYIKNTDFDSDDNIVARKVGDSIINGFVLENKIPKDLLNILEGEDKDE